MGRVTRADRRRDAAAARGGRRTGERGASSVELVLMAPALLLVLVLLVAGGRLALAGIAVESSAAAAARGASLSRTAVEAELRASEAAALSLAHAGVECAGLSIRIDTEAFGAALGEVASVSVTVRCTVLLTDVALPGVPGERTLTATATSPVDPFRERS